MADPATVAFWVTAVAIGNDLGETRCELLRTDAENEPCQHWRMQKKTTVAKSARTTLSSVKREMLEPRLTESVREALREEPALVVETPSAGSRKVSATVTRRF
jgi:hypothetical protein